jgi:hypothetical protein
VSRDGHRAAAVRIADLIENERSDVAALLMIAQAIHALGETLDTAAAAETAAEPVEGPAAEPVAWEEYLAESEELARNIRAHLKDHQEATLAGADRLLQRVLGLMATRVQLSAPRADTPPRRRRRS